MLIAIAVSIIVAALLGGLLGLKLGGLKSGPNGIYNVHRGRLSQKFGLGIALVLGAALGALLGHSLDAAAIAAIISAVPGASLADIVCGVLFRRFLWDGPQGD